MANEALKIVTQAGAEQARNALPRVAALDPGDELDPARLMDLLGDIDGIKREIHERMSRIDAVKEAKNLLTEEAARTEALNARLTEMNNLMKAVHSGTLPPKQTQEDAETSRLRRWEISESPETRTTTHRIPAEGGAIAWPKSEEPQVPVASGPSIAHGSVLSEPATELFSQAIYQGVPDPSRAEVKAVQQELKQAYESASQRLEEAERSQHEAVEANVSAQLKADRATLALAEARVREENAASELQSARQELTTAYQFASVAAQRRLESSEFFERTARWAVFASLFSWIATVWIGWIALIAFHRSAPVMLPILGTIILVLSGMVLVKRRVRISEDR